MNNSSFTNGLKFSRFILAFLVVNFVTQFTSAQATKNLSDEQVKEIISSSLNSISFIENRGQWPAHVLYRADVPGGQMLATPQGMLIGRYDSASLAAVNNYDGKQEEIIKGLKPGMKLKDLGPAPVLKGHGWRLNFVGGNQASMQTILKKGESKEYYNFFIGDASTHATNVHGYEELTYNEVYANVDVKYYTNASGDLENDIVVKPGADVKQIKLQIEGVTGLKLNQKGDLILPTTVGDIIIPAPISYARTENGRKSISSKYRLLAGNVLAFDVADYDKNATLVIDPIVMRWATWVSGNTTGVDAHNHGIDLDAAGNIYVTGRYGGSMITVGAFQSAFQGNYDVFIGKYIEPALPGNPGQRVWQTYMGTSGTDNPYAMNVGPDGNLYIVGMTTGNYAKTYGSGYPTPGWATQRTVSGNISQQSWVAKVSPNGTWALVRELGPATSDFSPTLWDIRTIPTGGGNFDLAVVGAVTQASNSADGDIPAATLPIGTAKTGTGDLNGYAFRISSDLNTLVWKQQFTSSGNNDDQFNIAVVDNAGDVYAGGFTHGSSGISYNNPSGQTGLTGSQDGWLMKLNSASGAAAWSRYYNSSSGNTLSVLCMEFNRLKTNLLIGGLTTGAASYNLTTSVAYGGSGDFFVASLPATGAATNWGTYYGGSAQEYNMMGLNVDQNDDIYVLGYTYSKNITTVDYPLQSSSFNTSTSDRQAIFFKLSGTNGATVLYSTYMGGSSDDYDPLGERGIKFNDCRIYLCVTAESRDFPLTQNTLTSTKTSSVTTLDPLIVSMSNPPDLTGNSITGGGTQTITCGQVPAAITAGVPTYIIPTIIRNNVAQTNGTTGAFPSGVPPINAYQWQMSTDTGATWSNISGATGQNYTPGNLNVTGLVKFRRIINGDACNRSGDTLAVVNIVVNPTTPAPTLTNNGPLCVGQTLQLTANTVANATYSWTGPNGFTSNLQNPTVANVTTAAAGSYKCIVTATGNGCPSYPSTTVVAIISVPAAPTASSNSPVCTGQTLNLSASGQGGAAFSWTGPNSFTSVIQSPSITNVTTANSGTYFVTQSVGGCVSPATSVPVVINTTPAPTLVGASPNPVCSGQTLTLTATSLSGATLNWTFPDGGGSTGSPVTRTATTAMAGTYIVTQTLNGCISNTASVSVVVNQTPAAPTAAASPNPVCVGSNLTLTATGQAGASFSWTYPDGGGASGSPVTRNSVTSGMAGTYSVSQTVAGCVSTSPGTVAVVINPVPGITAGSSSTSYCTGGTITLSSAGSGGTPAYSYSWSGPGAFSSSTQNPVRSGALVNMSGIYTVIVTDSKGCTASTVTNFITVNTSPTVIAASNSSSYCSGGSISLTSTPSSGVTPYSFSWSGPAGFSASIQNTSVPSVTTASSGVYSVTVTDANTCTASGSTSAIVVYQSPSIAATSNSPAYCSGATINLSSTPTNGTAPYNYTWSGPNGFSANQQNTTRPNATTLASGAYTVTVNDNHGCSASATTSSIVVYQSPSVTAGSTNAAYCASTTIQLNSTPTSGTTPYGYSWSGPLSFGSNLQNPSRPNATTSMSGVYTVLITDAHSCTASASTASIIINPDLVITANSNTPVCAGGTINLTGSSAGGTSPFTYSWGGPAAYTSSQQNPSLSGASSAMAGSYALTITDVNGCSGTTSTNVTVNPTASVSVSSNSPVCVGNSINLTATPAGGTGPFTYSWAGASGFTSAAAAPARNNAQLIYAGTYNVTVSDLNHCSGTGTTTVVVNPTPSVFAASSLPAYCVNNTVSLTATPSGGTAPYGYSWTGPLAFSDNQQNPNISSVTAGAAGTYAVTLTDFNGCHASSSVTFIVNLNPVADAGNNQVSCSGEAVTLGGNPTATGGLAPYSYVWNNGASNSANPSVNPLTSTTYTVVVTDRNTCTASANSTVSVNAKPVADAGVDKTIPSCSLVGTAIGGTPVASGGTGPYTYLWSPPSGLSFTNVANPNVTGIGATSTYTLKVTDANGCTASNDVVVNVTGSTLAVNVSAGGPVAWCAAGSSNVTFTANASGGSTPYTYIWTGAHLSSGNAVSTIANPDTAGTYSYSVVVTDATGCQASDSRGITVHAKPAADAGLANIYICNGHNATLGGNPTATGGTPPFTYVWTGGAAAIANPVVSPVTTSTYNVVVTDSNNCSASANATVVVRNNPIADAGADKTLPSCSPTGIQIGGSPTASGGSGSPFTYTWLPAPGLSSVSAANPTVVSIISDNTYTVIVTDRNGCTASDQVNVHVANNTPAVSISAGSSRSWCAGSSSSVNLSANVSGGSTPYSYSWNGSNISPLTSQTTTANPNSPGLYPYTVVVSDAFNCTATASSSVTVNSNPSANAGSESYIICNGENVSIGGNPTANGGTAPYTYSWNNGASPVANPVVSPVSTTSYTVVVTDTNSCTASANSTVTVRTNPVANAGNDITIPSCTPVGLQIGGSPTASGGGGGPYSYQWSPGTGLSSTTSANPSVAGISSDNTYTVVVRDVNGCTASDQVLAHAINNTPSINISASGITAWCSGSNSSVNLTANVTGGTAPVSYAWNGVNINPVNSQVVTVYPNSTGNYNYTVTVTDGFNCTATATKTIKVNAIPIVNAGARIYDICGGQNVTIGGNPTAQGGVPPYTYSWNSGANAVANPVVNPVTSTTYIVTVTDSMGCSAAASSTVLVRANIMANAGSDKSVVSCSAGCVLLGGSPTGAGGAGNLSYAWSPSTGLDNIALANPTACGLSNNTVYSLTVTDTTGCSATDQVMITINASSLTAEAGSGGALCLGSGDSVTLGGYPSARGGVPPYTYIWSPTTGLNLQNKANPEAFPIVTTTYYLTITDANGCLGTDTTVVRVYPVAHANAGRDTAVCQGSSVILGGNPTGSGGSGSGFSYAWSPTMGLSGSTLANPLATPITSINYIVTVTDGNGCTATDNVIVTVNLNPVAQAGNDKSITICPLDSITLGANPAATGGTPPYTYAWSPSTGLSNTSVPNPVVTGLGNTQTYLYTVTDANGCKSADNIIVTVTPNTLQLNLGANGPICRGLNACVQLGGLPTTIGGSIPYTYSWTNSGSLNNPASANPIACPLLTTLYALTVTDAKGCTITGAQTVSVNIPPVANAGVDTSFCAGNTVFIGGARAATSGIPPYTYAWSPPVGLSSLNIPNPAASPSVITSYQLLVTDSNGCTGTSQVTITPRSNPVADAGADKTIVSCTLDTTFIGGIPVVVNGGTGPFTYLWTPATGLSDSTSQTPLVSGLNTTTSYQVHVTDIFGCSGSDFVIVNVVPSTLQADAGNNGIICATAASPAPIGGAPTATGGSAPYQFHWSPALGLSSTTASNPMASPATTTTYYVTVTDAKGCSSTDSVKVVVNPVLAAYAGHDTAICADFGIIMGGSPTAVGGTAGYQYVWSPTTGLNSNNTSNPVAYPLATTGYSVTVTDSRGCQASSSITITVRQEPKADAGLDQTITACPGDSVRLGGSTAGSGGTPGYTYQWSPLNGLNNSGLPNPYVKGIGSSTVYTLTVTDANGCTGTDAVFVSVISSSLAAQAGSDAAYCSGTGASVTLGGSPTATGGTAPFIYTWSPSSDLSASNISNPVANPTASNEFYLTVTDGKGCTAVDSVKITVNPSPAAHAAYDTAICEGATLILGERPSATGGTSPYTYLWSPGTGLTGSTASNPIATPANTTSYTLTVTDSKGCTGSDLVNITVHAKPFADAGSDQALVACSTDSIQIGGSPSASGGTGPYTYNWSPNAGVSDISLANPFVSHLGSNATYTLHVTDSYGCSSSDQMTIIVSGSTLTAQAGNNVFFCSGNTDPATLGGSPTAVGGNPSYSYVWFPTAGLSATNVANPLANPANTTTYSVVITDANGCIAEDTVLVTVNPALIVNAGLADTVCAGSQIMLGGSPTAGGGSGSFIYQWTPSLYLNSSTVANPIALAQANITYALLVTDSMGCSNSSSITIKVNQNPVANAGLDKTLVSCQQACVSIGGSPTASGGTAPYLYAWSPAGALNNTGLPNPTACNIQSTTTYVVTVTDNNGCTATDQMLLTQAPSNLVANAGPDKSLCVGSASCITIGGSPSITGGTGPYFINWSPSTGICNSNSITNPDVKPLDTTNYILYVRDANGCVSIDSMTVSTNPLVTASLSPDTSICAGNSALLGNSPTAASGTPPFVYAWSPGQGLSSTTISNPTASPLSTTSYCVTITDAASCSATACQTIIVSPAVTACAGPVGGFNITACPGSYVVLGCTPTASGGSGNYSYSWSPDSVDGSAVLNGSTVPNPIVTGLTRTTIFTVTVTDNVTGCSAIGQVIVNVSASGLVADAGIGSRRCADVSGCVPIGGNPTGTGGTGPYIYQWSQVGGLNDPTIANPCASPSHTTNYAVTVTDKYGCSATDSVKIEVAPKLAIKSMLNNRTICIGSSVQIGNNPIAMGGTGSYTYSWTPSQFLNNVSIPNPVAVNVTSNITYQIVITDSMGCNIQANVTIATRALPYANAGNPASITACSGDSAQLGGAPTASGTTAPYTYQWYPPLNNALSCLTCSNPHISNLGSTTNFTVQVTDSFGCTTTSLPVTVTVSQNSLIANAGGANLPVLCAGNGSCVALGGSPEVIGGVQPYTYSWSGGPLSNNSAAHPQACPDSTALYTLVVTDAHHCQAFDTARVMVGQPPYVTIQGLGSRYCVNAGNIVMTGIPAGGTFTGAGVTGNIFQPAAVGPGSYCIRYAYNNQATGCSHDTTICISVVPLPVVSISGNATAYCHSDTVVTLIGSPVGGTFSGSGMVGNIFVPSQAAIGNDTITYTYNDSSTGCGNTAKVIITIKAGPVFSIAASVDTACGGRGGSGGSGIIIVRYPA